MSEKEFLRVGSRQPRVEKATPASPAAVLEALPAAVVVLDPAARVRYANPRAAETLATDIESLLGRPADVVLGERHEPTDAAGRVERRLLSRHGEERRFGSSESRAGDETIIVFRDISDVARLQRERDRLMSLAAIGEALPSLLHELKNPLAAVTTAVEVLVEELPEGEVQDHLHAILSELRRMKLGFEGIGAVHGELRSRRTHAIDFACREAYRVLRGRAGNAGIIFRCDIESMSLLPFDPSVVRAIVLNFVTNAIHASQRGDAVRLTVRLEQHPCALSLAVTDSGSGMTPQVLDRSSELFFTTKPSGSGIGLALCRRAIERARGSLEIRSVPGFGTLVHARVPVDEQECATVTFNRSDDGTS